MSKEAGLTPMSRAPRNTAATHIAIAVTVPDIVSTRRRYGIDPTALTVVITPPTALASFVSSTMVDAALVVIVASTRQLLQRAAIAMFRLTADR